MIRPLFDKILVKRLDTTVKTEGGLFIPPAAQEKMMEGVVHATGPGRWENGGFREPQVKTGDRVIFGKFAGTEIQFDGEEYLIIPEIEVLGVVKPPQK
jgi:chaperonin GroES